jgi:peptidoglycan L-alanyl-D-glutamate endopeptidase CwlK
MPNYGQNSRNALNTAEADLVVLFNEVIKYFDNTIVYANRDQVVQFELYKKGRSLINGVWVITDQSKIVTYKDGYQKMSMHNYMPSRAVDAVPWPVNWKDLDRMRYFAGHVMGIAALLKAENKIMHEIRYGGDWNRNTILEDETFLDLCHFEIII